MNTRARTRAEQVEDSDHETRIDGLDRRVKATYDLPRETGRERELSSLADERLFLRS